jgi:hypothetical protein
VELDHVLIAVSDLTSGGRELEARYGLESIEGGRHPGWGTANRIVPLGDAYLELIAVVDELEAYTSPIGRWVASAGASAEDPRLLGWAVRTEELDEVSARLELRVHDGSRRRPDGTTLSWRIAGIEEIAAEPSLPFFIEWGEGTAPPGRAAPSEGWSVGELNIQGDRARIEHWLGDHSLPITVAPGPPAITSFRLEGPGGRTVAISG